MAGFTLKFDAQTSGNYKIAYRDADDPCAVYQYKEVYVNNTSYPHEISVNIEIEGSLYCDDITYDGWILPMCFGEVYQPGQDVPDNATTFTHVMSKIPSDCDKLEIVLTGYKIESFDITNGGSGYDENDPPTLTIVRNDVLSSDYDAVGIVPIISGGEIVGVNFVSSGMNKGGAYNPQHIDGDTVHDPTVTITGGVGSGAVITPVLADSGDEFQLEDFACSSVGDSSVSIEFAGKAIYTCGKESTARSILPVHYDVSILDNECCYCDACADVKISTLNAVTGSVKYGYTKCWDNGGTTTYYSSINANEEVVLQNVIIGGDITETTVFFYKNTLSDGNVPVDPTLTYV